MAKPKPDEEKKAVTVCGRITTSENAALERIAEGDDRTTSYLVAKAVREYLERQGHAPRAPRHKQP